jgi:hypothetical protein
LHLLPPPRRSPGIDGGPLSHGHGTARRDNRAHRRGRPRRNRRLRVVWMQSARNAYLRTKTQGSGTDVAGLQIPSTHRNWMALRQPCIYDSQPCNPWLRSIGSGEPVVASRSAAPESQPRINAEPYTYGTQPCLHAVW